MDTVLRGVDASKNNLNRVLPVGSGLEVKMYCPECGSEVSEDSCFCGECGCKIREADMGTENIPETKFAGGLSFPASDADKEPYQEKKSDGKTGKTSVIAKAASAILAIAGCVVLVLGITGKLDGIGARIGNAMEGNQQQKKALSEAGGKTAGDNRAPTQSGKIDDDNQVSAQSEETVDHQTSGKIGDLAKPEKAGGTGEAVGKMAAMIGEPEGKENTNEGFHDEAVVSDKGYAGWEGNYVREQGPSSSIEIWSADETGIYFSAAIGYSGYLAYRDMRDCMAKWVDETTAVFSDEYYPGVMEFRFHPDGTFSVLESGIDTYEMMPLTGRYCSYENVDWSRAEFVLEESDSRLISEAELEGLGPLECKIARNEIYARYGRIFQDEFLQNYFESCTWYEGRIAAEDFQQDMLNETEKENANMISAYEQKMGYR